MWLEDACVDRQLADSDPHEEFTFTFVRSSGPGGQNVNKVNSKAVLRWPVMHSAALPAEVRQRFVARFGRRLTGEGELVLSSQRYRDQGRNVADCLEKLKSMLAAVAARPVVRKPTKPTARLDHPAAGAQGSHVAQKTAAAHVRQPTTSAGSDLLTAWLIFGAAGAPALSLQHQVGQFGGRLVVV